MTDPFEWPKMDETIEKQSKNQYPVQSPISSELPFSSEPICTIIAILGIALAIFIFEHLTGERKMTDETKTAEQLRAELAEAEAREAESAAADDGNQPTETPPTENPAEPGQQPAETGQDVTTNEPETGSDQVEDDDAKIARLEAEVDDLRQWQKTAEARLSGFNDALLALQRAWETKFGPE